MPSGRKSVPLGIYLVMLFFWFILANITLRSGFAAFQLQTGGQKINGVCLEVREVKSGSVGKGKRTNYRYSVQFQPPQRKAQIVEVHPWFSEFNTGLPVELLYLEAKPEQAQLNQPLSLWGFPLLFGFMAAGLGWGLWLERATLMKWFSQFVQSPPEN